MTDNDRSLDQARVQYECIHAFAAALDIDWDRFQELRTKKENWDLDHSEGSEFASSDYATAYPEDWQELQELEKIVSGYPGWKSQDDVMETIQQDPLEVSVRNTGWHSPSERLDGDEYRILLCTGGPAVQITGKLSEHNEPETAEIQHQDWGTPWTAYRDGVDEEVLLAYARQFYFGE